MKPRALAAACAVMFPLVLSTAPFLPTTSLVQAAASRTPSITGTLVAAPQMTLPTALLLQVGGQTIPVVISGATRVLRADGSSATLGDLHTGDTITIVGDPNRRGGINADEIRDFALTAAPSPTATSTPSATISPTPSATPSSSPTVYVSPTSTASPTAIPPTKLDVRGILAGQPSQLAAPATLCLFKAQVSGAVSPNLAMASPCPPGQLPVFIDGNTRLVRNDSSGAALDELRTGDNLEVRGVFNAAQYTATYIADHSLHLTYTQFTGTVQSVAPNGMVTNVVASVDSRLSSHSPVPSHAQVLLLVANAGSPNCTAPSNAQFPCTTVTIGGSATQGYTGAGIVPSSIITAAGLYNDQLKQFEYVSWLTIATPALPTATPAPPAPTATPVPSVSVSVSLAGYLASLPRPTYAPTILCLRSVQISANRLMPNVAQVSACPPGQLPVYVTTSTRITRNDGQRVYVGSMHSNHRLEVTGTFVNGQYTATSIRDRSIHTTYQIWFRGKIQYISPNTKPTYLALRVTNVRGHWTPYSGGAALTVYLQSNTSVVVRGHTYHRLTVLNPGQQVRVWGTYDQDDHTFYSATRIQL